MYRKNFISFAANLILIVTMVLISSCENPIVDTNPQTKEESGTSHDITMLDNGYGIAVANPDSALEGTNISIYAA